MEAQDVEKVQEDVIAFVLPIGMNIGGKDILSLPIADTGSEAEKIYTKKPKSGKLHTWMAQVISASVSEINGVPIASEFFKLTDPNAVIPEVAEIPFLDAGSLMIQIQRECWEETILDQRIKCTNCGENITADVELSKIATPDNGTGKALLYYEVNLKKPHIIRTGAKLMEDYEGYKFNRLTFRTATLGDAIKHEGVLKDEVQFWRNLAFDTLLKLEMVEPDGTVTAVPDGFLTRRGKALFQNDFDSKKLKEIRSGMQITQPSAKTYYEEACPKCGEDTPFFASVSNFFRA